MHAIAMGCLLQAIVHLCVPHECQIAQHGMRCRLLKHAIHVGMQLFVSIMRAVVVMAGDSASKAVHHEEQELLLPIKHSVPDRCNV